LLASHPTAQLKDYPLAAVRDYLINIFTATFHAWRLSPPSATREHAMPWWQGSI